MTIFLQILGAVVLVIILLILGIYLYFKIKFGKYLSVDEERNQTPLVLHLNEDLSPGWMDEKKLRQGNDALLQLGFERGKSYSIPEMPDVRLTAYFKPPLLAVLYKHEIAGSWVDILLQEKEGPDLTVTNVPMGEATEHRPDKTIVYLKEASIPELHEHILSLRQEGDVYQEISQDNFREYFEKTYRKDMAYRARHGGMSFEEFLRHEKEFGKKISDKHIREAFVMTKRQELYQWEELVTEEYLKGLSEDEQEAFYDSGSFIVPFSTDAEAFIQYLESHGFIDEDDEENLSRAFREETDIFKLFDTLNEGRSPELRAKLVKEADYPLELKIYRL